LILALVCAAINMVLGIAIGALWGYSKVLDGIFNVIYNIIANVPYLLLISILVSVLGSSVFKDETGRFISFIIALTITGWLGIAYFFRNQVLIIRDREYNLASRCLGTNIFRVVSKNVLPYLTSVIVTVLATEIPAYIGMEVYLTYIGIGLSAKTASIGHMINIAQDGWLTFPWPFWVPVFFSSVLTISLYVMGQNLADASDPRSHMQ
jgi:oligopeptide transport system permease protein